MSELPGKLKQLTRRECEVLQLVAQGMTNREIASTLELSAGTVKVYIQHIFFKLGVEDRTQAAVLATKLVRNQATYSTSDLRILLRSPPHVREKDQG